MVMSSSPQSLSINDGQSDLGAMNSAQNRLHLLLDLADDGISKDTLGELINKLTVCLNREVEGQNASISLLPAENDCATSQSANDAVNGKAISRAEHFPREVSGPQEQVFKGAMFDGIVGSSNAILGTLEHVARVAPTDCTVLITGESGTGKELIARALHKGSRRSCRPFVRVNCAAIPPALIASELFGHERGAFTGASERRLGRFELANGGTIFLDEIGDIPAETQVALLRVLQEREFERVGGNRAIPLDVRVVAATNQDLASAVSAGAFRLDLFYRLNVYPIGIPPLRQRGDDIPLLTRYFVDRYAAIAGKKIGNIPRSVIELFQSYHWPGNIRELQNMVERAVISSDGDLLSVDESWMESSLPERFDTPSRLTAALTEREKDIIESALEQSRGRISGPSGAASKLGVPRSTLESKIRSLHINKHRFRAEANL